MLLTVSSDTKHMIDIGSVILHQSFLTSITDASSDFEQVEFEAHIVDDYPRRQKGDKHGLEIVKSRLWHVGHRVDCPTLYWLNEELGTPALSQILSCFAPHSHCPPNRQVLKGTRMVDSEYGDGCVTASTKVFCLRINARVVEAVVYYEYRWEPKAPDGVISKTYYVLFLGNRGGVCAHADAS